MFRKTREEIKSIRERDPAARGFFTVFFLYSGYKAVSTYRIAHFFEKHGYHYIARMISQHSRKKTGIEIHPAAEIGRKLFIDHGMGVVIGETTIIGENVTIYQGATLGGTGKDEGKRHPTIGNNVMIGAGAKILGPFTVGENAKIAANAVVLSEVPPNSTAVGVPARIVMKDGKKIPCQDLDQVHFPDPVSQEFCKLLCKIEILEKKLEKLGDKG
ncbi:MAG: serine O-acetyltransferase EpsC [Clostridia bacterium]